MNRELLKRSAMVLDHPLDYVWTTQGFGMIRAYLDTARRFRLNVWDSRLRTPGVSDVHDHPWDFTSLVLCGQLNNIRYTEVPAGTPEAVAYQHTTIRTGEDVTVMAPTDTRWLLAAPREIYIPGHSYHQQKLGIHNITYIDGTVTLNDRTPPTPEHTARVYWLEGTWEPAPPRSATKAEIYGAVEQAMYQARLDRWSRA